MLCGARKWGMVRTDEIKPLGVAMKPENLSPPDVAREYPTSENTLADWRKKGKGPRYFKFGRRVFYRRSDIEAWIAEQSA